MPSTLIATGEWAQGREMELIMAVQSTLLTALQIPEWDRDVLVDLYDRKRRIVPTRKSEQFTRIEIKLFIGRSLKAKRALYQSIVQNLFAVGIPRDEIKIVLVEIPLENWGVRGGLPASDSDIGFKVNV